MDRAQIEWKFQCGFETMGSGQSGKIILDWTVLTPWQ